MRTAFTSSCLVGAVALCAALAVPELAAAQPYHVGCEKGGDELGWAIANNGDFNGDGVADIAIGSPCYFVRQSAHAGRVIVLDGRNGKRLFRKMGNQLNQWFGAGLSFIGDQNRDGRDELAIGSPGYDVTGFDQGDPQAGTKEQAGRVDVYTKRKRRMKIFGANVHSGFGERIAPTDDIDGEGHVDFLVSASTDSKPDGRSQPGRVWLVSGRNGDLLSFRVGPKAGKNFGRALSSTDDMDGDGLRDFLAGSDEINIPNVFNAGEIQLVSTVDMLGDELLAVDGAQGDRLGRTVDYAGIISDDNVPKFIVGAYGADDSGIKKSGLVTLFTTEGERVWVRQDSEVQHQAHFGDAVTSLGGDINGDGVIDFAASAPDFDIFVDKKAQEDAGRVVTMSGFDGQIIWSLNGDHRDNQLGYALAGRFDFDLDETNDLLVGSPGDGPLGRRGAGSVRFLSGVDGHELFRVAGRRGLETRIVTVTPETGSRARLRSFKRSGRGVALNTVALDGVNLGELDVTVLNDRNIPKPKSVQAAVSAGHGSNDSTVQVWRMGRRSIKVDEFEAFPDDNFGVECDGGQTDDQPFEELVCAQSDSNDGNVRVRILQRLDEQQPFFPNREFQVFASTDMLNPLIPIDADGANVAVGDVTGGNEEEIVVGTNRGVPLVKIFTREGVFIRSFLAYDPAASSGVDVAVIDSSGAGEKQIVTAPREGEALIKMFDGNGNRVLAGRDNIPVSVQVRPPGYTGGARVGAADVDLDDKQEMLVLIPTPAGDQEVSAWELTNDDVKGFTPFLPAGLTTKEGGSIAGTDRFVRD